MTGNDYFNLDSITDKLIILNNAMVMQNEQLINVKSSIDSFVSNELQVQSEGFNAVRNHMYLYESIIDLMQYVNSLQISKVSTIMSSEEIGALDAVWNGSTINGCDVLDGKSAQISLRSSLQNELNSIVTGTYADLFSWRIYSLRSQISDCDDLIADYNEIISAFDGYEEYTQGMLTNSDSNPVYNYSCQISSLMDDLVNSYSDGTYVYSSEVQERITSLYDAVAANICSEYYVNGEIDVDAVVRRVSDTSHSLTPTDYYALANIMSDMTDEELEEFLSSTSIPSDRMISITYAYRQRAYADYANSGFSDEERHDYLRASEAYVYSTELARVRSDCCSVNPFGQVVDINLDISTNENGDYVFSVDFINNSFTESAIIHREIYLTSYSGSLDMEGKTDLVTQNGVVYYQDSTGAVIFGDVADYAVGKVLGKIPGFDELSAIYGGYTDVSQNNRNQAFTANALSLLGYTNNMGILNGTDGTMIVVGPSTDYHEADTVTFFEVNYSDRDLLIASAAYVDSTTGSVNSAQATEMENDIISSYVNATGIENAEELQNADVFNDFADWERTEENRALEDYRDSLEDTLNDLNKLYPDDISIGSINDLSVEQTKVLIDYNGHPENIQGDDLALFM